MRKMLLCAAVVMLSACSQSTEAPEDATDTASDTEAAATDTPTEAAYDGPIPMPIRVGGDGPDMDACGTYAEVTDFDAEAVAYASVRDAPSNSVKERDRLDAGQGVQVCATSESWSGIVYSKDGEPEQDCGIGTPAATEQNYTGPCSQGWVETRFLEMIAG